MCVCKRGLISVALNVFTVIRPVLLELEVTFNTISFQSGNKSKQSYIGWNHDLCRLFRVTIIIVTI